ncbi:MAG: hypothetical protein JRI23_03345, partial [Deltaproteobacteria bacterium]|nr:hypothetical protein [Deltaproteobacteria bacterium]MBW2530545.1 hypothetical protein [Deltaproteobacteria bacterium]
DDEDGETEFASDALDFDDAEEIDEETEAFVDFEARVAAQHHSYLYKDDVEPSARNGIEAGLRVHGGVPQATATLSVLARHDFSDEARRRIDVDEAFVDVGPAWLSLRGGRLLETWGTASLYNPTDILNPRDLRDPIEAEKLGVWALRLRSVLGPVALEGYLLPVPEAHPLPPITGLDDRGLPTSTSRWFRPFAAPVLPGPLVTNVVAGGPPEAKVQNFQGAFRAGLSVVGIDLALGYAYLFDRMPTLRLVPVTLPVPPAPTIINASLEHPRIHVGMAEIERAFGGLRLAAEGVLVAREIDDELGIDGASPYVIAVAGADYRLGQVADIHDFHFFLEALTSQAFDGELPSDPIGRIRYLARYGALGRIRYELDGALFVESSAFSNLEDYEVYLRPAAGYRFFERVTLELGADLFFGDPETVMGSYRRNKRITFELVGEI